VRAKVAVVPAAGLGTRFLPVTKSVPKELLPIIDTPALQLVIDEAVNAGIEHVVLVSSRAKPGIEAYVTPDAEVVRRVRASGRVDLADRLERIGSAVEVSVVYQDEPRGLGHAVGCAREIVGDRPFAVMLPDELMADSALLGALIDHVDTAGVGAIGLMRVPKGEVGAYGVITPAPGAEHNGPFDIVDVVEKPHPDEAPSNLIIIGRYVLTPDVFDRIAEVVPGAGGEIQLTDALRMQAHGGPFHGVLRPIRRHDTGNPLGWLTAVVDIALDDPNLGDAFREWLQQRR